MSLEWAIELLFSGFLSQKMLNSVKYETISKILLLIDIKTSAYKWNDYEIEMIDILTCLNDLP